MPGSFTDYGEDAILEHLFGGTTFAPLATWYIGFFSAAPTDSSAGTELAGNGYARKAVTNNTTNFPLVTAGNPKLLAVDTECFTASADHSDAVAVGLFDASTSGNLIAWAWLGNDSGKVFTATTADVFTCVGHSFGDTNKVRVVAIPGTSLPTGISAGTTYFIRDSATDTFKLAATSGGAAIDITAAGSGLIALIQPKVIQNGDTVRILANELSISLD